MTGSIFVTCDPETSYRLFPLFEYGSNVLQGTILSEETQGWGIVKKVLLHDRLSFPQFGFETGKLFKFSIGTSLYVL